MCVTSCIVRQAIMTPHHHAAKPHPACHVHAMAIGMRNCTHNIPLFDLNHGGAVLPPPNLKQKPAFSGCVVLHPILQAAEAELAETRAQLESLHAAAASQPSSQNQQQQQLEELQAELAAARAAVDALSAREQEAGERADAVEQQLASMREALKAMSAEREVRWHGVGMEVHGVIPTAMGVARGRRTQGVYCATTWGLLAAA